MVELTEEEKKALRGSKFAPLPAAPPPFRSQPRQAHPGGPIKTNKAAALAKFLERKLHQDPNGLSSVDPKLVELAVKDAKRALSSCGSSGSGRTIHHVDSFGDSEDSAGENAENAAAPKKQKKAKRKWRKRNKKAKAVGRLGKTEIREAKKEEETMTCTLS